MVNKPDVAASARGADDLLVLCALLKTAGLPSTVFVAERVLPFWIAARGRARNIEDNIESRVIPAHVIWP